MFGLSDPEADEESPILGCEDCWLAISIFASVSETLNRRKIRCSFFALDYVPAGDLIDSISLYIQFTIYRLSP